MSEQKIGRWMVIWLVGCALFFCFTTCFTVVEEGGRGNWTGAFGAIVFAPLFWWITTRVGVLVFNVLFVAGQVLDAQVTHADEIRKDDE